MNPVLRNILAVLIGAIVCMVLNGLLLGVMMKAIPPPIGFDPNELASYSVLEARHLMSPFVAHAVPSLIGGLLAALIAATRKMTFALMVGGLHLIGGIAAAFLIPAPAWFIALDLVVAYLPMAWLGGKLGTRAVQA
jgi:hypothetical protein